MKERRWTLAVLILAVLAIAGGVALAQSGPAIKLNSPVSFPIDI